MLWSEPKLALCRSSVARVRDIRDAVELSRFCHRSEVPNCGGSMSALPRFIDDVYRFIDDVYNAKRGHSALGYKSPSNLRSNTPGRWPIERRSKGCTPTLFHHLFD